MLKKGGFGLLFFVQKTKKNTCENKKSIIFATNIRV